MISIAALIYRSTKYADAVWNSAHDHTPHLSNGRARFFFVANDATEEVIGHLTEQKYPFVEQHNARLSDDDLKARGFGPPEYIRRVYQGWNRAVLESDEEMCLVNSDMMFSPGWFDSLLKWGSEDRAVVSRLVERKHPKHGVNPAAIEADFGDTPWNFDADGFVTLAQAQSAHELLDARTYAPIFMRRSKAIKAGLYPEGNLGNEDFTVRDFGDAVFVKKLASVGVNHMMAMDSIVYHFKEGEMGER